MADLRGRRVLVLNWRDSRHPEGGGSELYVEQMAAGLVDRGAEVTMMCPRYPGAPRRETIDGVRHLRVGGRLSIYLLFPLLVLLRLAPRHDLVLEVQNGVPFLASAYTRKPVVVLVHHVHREQWPIIFGPTMARVGWWLESRLAPRVSARAAYLTVSEATRRELVGLGVAPEAIDVVHNGSPDPGAAAPSPRSEVPTVLALGRLVPHKRVQLAIESLTSLAEEFPDVRLVVAGEGWWHENLTELASTLGVADRVEFTGRLSEREKFRALCDAWVLAMPSAKEGWGLVVVEAATCQTPAVGFHRAGGVAESIVDGVTGLLVDDDAGFADALGRLLRDDVLRKSLGYAAETHARQFTWAASRARFAERVAQLLEP